MIDNISDPYRDAALNLIGQLLEAGGSVPESRLNGDDLVVLRDLAAVGVVERAAVEGSRTVLRGPAYGTVRVYHQALQEHGTYWYAQSGETCLVQFDGYDGATEVSVSLLHVTGLVAATG